MLSMNAVSAPHTAPAIRALLGWRSGVMSGEEDVGIGGGPAEALMSVDVPDQYMLVSVMVS